MIVLPSPMSSARQAPSPSVGELDQPGEAVALVVAQRAVQPRRRVDRLAGGRGLEPVAHRQQAGADDDLLLDVVDLDGAGQRRGDGLDRGGVADQPLLGLAGDGRVDDGPVVAQLEDRGGGAGELVHLLLAERLAVQRDLPAEGEDGVGREQAGLQRLLVEPAGRSRRRTPVEDRAGAQVATQAARPEHVDPALLEGADPVVEQADQLVGVEGDLVGDPQLEQPLEDRPGLGGATQRDAGVGAGPAAEAVAGARAGLGPEQGGVADVERVLLVVHLEHQAHRPGDQLLLVGLDPQREGHQLGQVLRRGVPVAVDAGLEPRARSRPGGARRRRPDAPPAPRGRPPARRTGRGRGRPLPDQRRTARQRVDDRVQHLADQAGRVVHAEVGVGPRPGQHRDPVVVGVVEPGHPPLRRLGLGRLEATRRDQPHPQQRRAGQQRHARVQVVARMGAGEHRQRGAHGQADRAPVVAELDVRVPRRVGRDAAPPAR